MEVDRNIVEEFKELSREDVKFTKNCAKIAQEISSGQLTIVQLVEQLGGLLVDTSPDNREFGTWILTQVLEELFPNQFDNKQLNFICTFYVDRLKDHHQVLPAVLRGILALAKFEQFPDGTATQILSTFFQYVSCQQQQQKDRNNIYRLFQILLQKRSTELRKMGLDYVYGVISAVDGERDPKNLIFLFNWFPTFLKTVKLGHLNEECFEILACYFPVDFKAPPQDPNTITRDNLANALTPCLTAVPEFADFCFSLALEKLDASLEVAKLDSLKLLEAGCENFDTASYVQHSTEIWSQIQKELFNNPNPEIESACLSALTALIRKISEDSSLNATVKDISDTVKRNLLPDSKLFAPSWKLLLSVAKGSKISCGLITKDIIPILINTFNITKTTSRKIVILNILIDFFECYVKLHENIEFEELNNIPILCLKSALNENNELRVAGFDGLGKIAKFLTYEVRIPIYENLQKNILISQNNDVRLAIIKCFDQLSKNYPEEIKKNIIDSINIENKIELEHYLDALCAIAPEDFFINYVIDIFIKNLQLEASLGEISVNAFKKLLHLYENEKILNKLLEKNLIDIMVDWCLKEAIAKKNCLANVSYVLKTIIGNQSPNQQRDIVDKQLPKIVDLSKPNHLLLLDGILCNLWKEVEINYILIDDLTKLAIKNDDDFVRDVAVQLLANLINKCDNESVLNDFLSHIEENTNDMTILTWITKALVMRNHEKTLIWTDKLIELLKQDVNVAKSFRIIINDNYEVLSEKSHCVKTILYQQKFFILVSTKLNEIYQPELSSCLVAFGYLLEHTPRQAILLQFSKISRLFILCLEKCEEIQVLTVLLEILRDFTIQKEKCIEDHLTQFLTTLLTLCSFGKSMQVRILALKCLQEYPSSFPVYKLLPHKMDVLKILGKIIDDKKRIVRREAVEARSLWFLFDSPM